MPINFGPHRLLRFKPVLLLLSIFLSFLFARRTKPRILHFTLDPTRPAWIERERLELLPSFCFLFLLLFSLLARGLLTRFEFASVDLLNPFVHATTAWLIYRLVAGLTHNQFWLRLAAVLAFGIAALQSFGLLEPTFEFLGSLSFAVGKEHSICARFGKWDFYSLPFMDELALGECRGISNPPAAEPAPLPCRSYLAKVVRVFLIFISFLVAMSTIGLDLSSFALLGGAIGVGIGFGLQKVVSNLVSGLILLLDRSMIGDVIEIDDTYGWINPCGLAMRRIITRDGKEHLIPNEDSDHQPRGKLVFQ